MEEIKEMRMVKTDYKCPDCIIGYLRPILPLFEKGTTGFPHKCNNPECNYKESFANKLYPIYKYQ